MFWTTAALIAILVCRRYRPSRYSTQRFSRRGDYIEKSEVSPLKVPWSVRYESYSPRGNPHGFFPFWWLYPTFADGRRRCLVEVSPYILTPVPWNPFGRTGVVGKGLFAQYGPNRMTVTVYWSATLGFLKMAYLGAGRRLHRGYVDHPLNTDNAWVEADIRHVELQDFAGVTEDCEEWLRPYLKGLHI